MVNEIKFIKKRLSEMIDWPSYQVIDNDCGSNYQDMKVYKARKGDDIYLIRFPYSSFGADEIWISDRPLDNLELIRLEPFDKSWIEYWNKKKEDDISFAVITPKLEKEINKTVLEILRTTKI